MGNVNFLLNERINYIIEMDCSKEDIDSVYKTLIYYDCLSNLSLINNPATTYELYNAAFV